ncbi:MAG: hypothetical protein A2Y69_12510 [Candidatus Aminicenantes bacterium RBG_13_59_9]|nr:MAG: hypothetical protein A2Y69_12510 [Candidatus Aminicenantes bacterium RBG_13_59_9]
MSTKSAALLLFLFLAFFSEALANKTSVALVGPDSVAAGTEVTITVNVGHKGNNAFHYTNWVWVKADGVEIARWEFKASSRPESGNFSREVKYTVTKPVEITAQGNCKLHGSTGQAALKIGVN